MYPFIHPFKSIYLLIHSFKLISVIHDFICQTLWINLEVVNFSFSSVHSYFIPQVMLGFVLVVKGDHIITSCITSGSGVSFQGPGNNFLAGGA